MHREIKRDCPTCGQELVISYELDGYKAVDVQVESEAGTDACPSDPLIIEWAESEAQLDATEYLQDKADSLREN